MAPFPEDWESLSEVNSPFFGQVFAPFLGRFASNSEACLGDPKPIDWPFSCIIWTKLFPDRRSILLKHVVTFVNGAFTLAILH